MNFRKLNDFKFTLFLSQVMLYNTLISLIHRSLGDLLKALKGLVVMSDALERMSTSVFNNSVPDMWANKAYPSLKPLGSWVADLLQVSFLSELWFNSRWGLTVANHQISMKIMMKQNLPLNRLQTYTIL